MPSGVLRPKENGTPSPVGGEASLLDTQTPQTGGAAHVPWGAGGPFWTPALCRAPREWSWVPGRDSWTIGNTGHLLGPFSFFSFFLFYKFIYFILFLAALGLRCCTCDFSSCGERGLLFVAVHGLLIAVHGLLIAVASLVEEQRL